MHLYRAISLAEYDDLNDSQQFRTAHNTLEGKQFFKSIQAVKSFARISSIRNYRPPYRYLVIVTIDDIDLSNIPHDELILDGFEAISIHEVDLPAFNNNINFELDDIY